MDNKFTPQGFENTITVEKLVTVFYMELSKHFSYEGESHDFWEMVYIDKGELVCRAGDNRFVLKSGEIAFHRPNEFHNHSANGSESPNVSIISFVTRSRAMKSLANKIFKLDSREKELLSQLFEEALSCYRMTDAYDPLDQRLERIPGAPLGSAQLTKNLLETFLIRLCRRADPVSEGSRASYLIDGVDMPLEMKRILEFLESRVYGRISVADVAKAVGKSESATKQLFARYRDKGILHCYNSMKIREAKKLIREGEMNMAQISDALKFDNPQYFSKCFKSHTNLTPSQYKSSIIK